MPSSKNYKRDYKQEAETAKARGEHADRMERQRARRAFDAKGVDRKGKVIDHIKPLSKGGDNSNGNLRLTTVSKNASFPRNSDGSIKSTKKTKGPKK